MPEVMKARLTALLLLAVAAATESTRCTSSGKAMYNQCGERCICTNGRLAKCTRIRRDFYSMPWGERMRFIRTLLTASTKQPSKMEYERLVAIHTKTFNEGIHTKRQFLPWHRWYLMKMENILRKIDCRVTVPYWDWSLFSGQPWRRRLNDIFSSAPWGLGGNGGRGMCVTDGPFNKYTWKTTASNDGKCLKRRFNGNPPDIVAVAEVLKYRSDQFDEFEIGLRDSLHNNMHCRIGGNGGTMCSRSSANAPEFLLHHGFTDKLWSDWQKKGPAYKNAYYSRMSDKMLGTSGARIRDYIDLNNHGGIRVQYEDPLHSNFHELHKDLGQLEMEELWDLKRRKFTPTNFLEFKVFMVNRKEQAIVKAQQKSLEPEKALSPKDHLSEADKALGFRFIDVEKALKRKREFELTKKGM